MVLHILYLIGVGAFAISGVLAAHKANMDPFGAIVLAILAGLGGGTTRDLLLNRHPLYWLHDWVLLTVILGCAVATIGYLRFRMVPRRVLLLVDALGLAVVTVIGARAAIAAQVHPLAVVMLAVVTGVTGEVIRDVLAGELPPLLLREEIYATCAAAGALVYLLLHAVGVPGTVNTVGAAAVVFMLRMIAIITGANLPTSKRARQAP